MKFQKIILFLISLTLIVGQYGRKHGGEKTRMLMKWKLTKFLDLQEEQAEKFFPRFNNFHKDHKKIQSEIGELYDEINKMVKDEEVKQKEVEKFVNEIYELEIKKHSLRKDFILAVDNILSEDQQARLAVFEHNFKRRMKDEMPHFKDHFKKDRRGKKHRF